MRNLSVYQFGALRVFEDGRWTRSGLRELKDATVHSLLKRGYLSITGKDQVVLSRDGVEALATYRNATPPTRKKPDDLTERTRLLLAVARRRKAG